MEEVKDKTPRLLISFVVDNSASVSGELLGELMRGFRAFAETAPDYLEWELLTFDTLAPVAAKSFSDKEIAPVQGNRFALMGRAANTAANRLTARMDALRGNGEIAYRPWMFLLSGGFTVDAMEETVARLDAMERREELMYLPFKLSDKLETERLQCLDRSKHMIEILPGKLDGFFDFLNRIIEQRAALAPDVGIKFSKTDFEGWAVL